jgi:hypothetical protein
MMRFRRTTFIPEEWDRQLEEYPDSQVFQTAAWILFLEETQGGEPVVAELEDRGSRLGLFAGLIVRKYGFRILGSPFPGWTTPTMGVRLRQGVCPDQAASALIRFAFDDLKCHHLEARDILIAPDGAFAAHFHKISAPTLQIDLSLPEDQLFAAMSSACRRCIRKARKEGVTIEEARDSEFVNDYFNQLEDVFAKQSLIPTYTKARVAALIRHLLPTGRLLLLRARDKRGKCIGTGIFPAHNTHMFFWGGASFRDDQRNRPNEAIQWYAMRYWKQRGITRYDMCGLAEYKRKYGASELHIPLLRKSKYRFLNTGRDMAKRLEQQRQWLLGRSKNWWKESRA